MDGAEKRDVKFKRRIIISAVLSLIAVIYIIDLLIELLMA